MNKDVMDKILVLLRKCNFSQQANDIEMLYFQYKNGSKDEKERAGEQIKQMCHPRWLGDLFIQDISFKEWYSLLDLLRRSIH